MYTADLNLQPNRGLALAITSGALSIPIRIMVCLLPSLAFSY